MRITPNANVRKPVYFSFADLSVHRTDLNNILGGSSVRQHEPYFPVHPTNEVTMYPSKQNLSSKSNAFPIPGALNVHSAEITASWDKTCRRLRAELGEAKYNSWFARIELERVVERTAHLSVPTKFLKSWIQTHYFDRLKLIFSAEASEIEDVVIFVRTSARPIPRPVIGSLPNTAVALQRDSATKTSSPGSAKTEPSILATSCPSQFSGSPLDRRMTFDAFVVGSSNRMAHAACLKIVEQKANEPVLFNPLFLHANVGLGKTHLVQAVAQAAAAVGKNIVYLTAEKFMYGFVASLKSQTAIAFKESLRAIDILIIDDVQFLNGKIIQQEFGHVLNSLLDSGRQAIISADRPPQELESLEERIKSRLTGGLCLELGELQEDLRYAILQARLALAQKQQPGFEVPELIMRYIARTIDTNGRDLEGAVNRLLAWHTLTNALVTMESAEEAIRDLVRMREPKKTKIEDIQKLVANHYNVTRADLLSSRRTASVVRPRQVAMFLAKVLTLRSLPEIGRRFGGRDHTTVLHAVRKIEGLTSTDRALAQDIEFLKRMLTEA